MEGLILCTKSRDLPARYSQQKITLAQMTASNTPTRYRYHVITLGRLGRRQALHRSKPQAALAQRLQELHTQLRETVDAIARRMETVHLRAKPETWLYPTSTPWRDRVDTTPSSMDSEAKAK